MDTGLDFARKLLDQLRRDLRQHAYGRLKEADLAIGRSVQYLRRVSPERLQLADAFAVMRFLGYRPFEYLARLEEFDGLGTPPGLFRFFRRYRMWATDTIVLPHLPEFLQWAEDITVEEGHPDFPHLDIQSWLASLDLTPPGGEESIDKAAVTGNTIFAYGDLVLRLCTRRRLPDLSPASAQGLCNTLLLFLRLFPIDPPHLRASSQILDLGFRVEYFLNDPGLRHELYSVASVVIEKLGYPYDALWISSQAAEIAMWNCDPEAAQAARQRIEYLTELHQLQDVCRIVPDGPPPVSCANYLRRAQADQRRTFWAVTGEWERRTSAGTLYPLIGCNSLNGIREATVPVSVEKWARLVFAAGTTPAKLLHRTAPLDTQPLPTGGLLQRLKVAGRHTPKYQFQTSLLSWAQAVEIVPTAPSVGSLPESFAYADQPTYFDPAIQGFQAIVSSLPPTIRPAEARTICEGLIRAGYNLGLRVWLDDAVDLTDAALHLLDKLSPTAQLAFSYRMAASLAINLGHLQTSGTFLRNAKEVELSLGSDDGFYQSLCIESVVFLLNGNPRQAAKNYETTIQAVQKGLSKLPLSIVQIALAAVHIRTDRIGDAIDLVKQAEAIMPGEPHSGFLIEYLLVKAEALSRTGAQYEEPLHLLRRAADLFDLDENPKELALIGLEKCAHLLRYGQSAAALQEAQQLFGLAGRLKRNPLGARALLELVGLSIENALAETHLRVASQTLRFPNVR